MITNAFAVFDKKTGVYGQPFFSNHEVHAIRSVQQAANDLSTSIGQYPADYSLYRVGTYDDASGALCAVDPEHVVEVISLVTAQDVQLPLIKEA